MLGLQIVSLSVQFSKAKACEINVTIVVKLIAIFWRGFHIFSIDKW
jgi:hypothetical protein